MWSKANVSVGTSTQGTALAYLRGSDGLIHTDGAVEAAGNVWSSSYLSGGKNAPGGTKAYLRGSDGYLYTKGSASVQGSLGVGVASAMYSRDVGGTMQVRGGMIILRPIDAGGRCVVSWNQNGTLLSANNQACPAIP